jgi:hypothetical protein
MLKKIVLGVILVTVIGAAGTALAANLATQEASAFETSQDAISNGITAANRQTSTTPQTAAQGAEGEPWQAAGTIAEVNDYGFQFVLQNGEQVYIELGPPDYWRSQGVELRAGQAAVVEGTINDGMIHAAQVALSNGQTLQVRAGTGQPLWSGGVDNSRGQNGAQADGDHIPDPQAQVDEWVTLTGTLVSFQGGSMTMTTPAGKLVAFQTGQPRFFAEQGVTFNVGDEIVVVGFFQDGQFSAGEITQVGTGLKVMLRDPNGRPLWAGPGNSNGNGSGNSNGSGNGNRNGGNR